MDSKDLEIEIVPSMHDPSVGAHVGIRIRHNALNLTVESTSQKTQYANKQNAIQLMKERFLETEGNTFLNNLDESDK
jgi:protein subunit release factor A